MKKVLPVILFCVLFCETALSQINESKKTAFQLSFFTPLSTNGLYSSQYTNTTSLNLLVGVSKNETAFTIGGLANIILNDATGFQLAGVSNYVGNDGRGVLFAGLANITGDYKGAQFAGLANIAKDVRGVQFGGLINKAKNVDGAQFAGLINIAKDVRGVQFGGLINKAKNVDGAQFAGLINIAENSDCPIGLINIIKNGEKGIAITYNELGSAMVTFRSGGKITYGIIGVGYNHKISSRTYVFEAGLGAHINCLSWLRINNELKVASFGSSSDALVVGDKSSNPVFHVNYSIMPAFRISRHFELFGGPSINYANARNTDIELIPNHSIWKRSGSARLQQIYIGYQVGVQYIF